MKRKGRGRGRPPGGALTKLTDSQIKKGVGMAGGQKKFGRLYGVSQQTVSREIVTRGIESKGRGNFRRDV